MVPMTASERVLAAANALMAERGPTFTLREAARRADVSHATPGFLFGDLRGLVTQVAVGGFERFAQAMEEAETLDEAPLVRLLAVGEAYVAFALREPHVFRLMMSGEVIDRNHPALVAINGQAYGPLYRQMQQLHGITVESPAFLARLHLAWSVVHGIARLILDGPLSSLQDDPAALRAIIAPLAPSLTAPIV